MIGIVEAKKPYHHGNLKAVLSRAALKLVGETGLGAFTLREVARRAGVSHNAPYRHFKKREDVFAALATEGFHQLNTEVQKELETTSDASARLRLAARIYLRFAFENPARFAVMFHAEFDRHLYQDYVAAYRRSLEVLTQLIENCNVVAAESADTASALVWANIHGIAELGLARRLTGESYEALQPLADTAVDALLHGMPKVFKPAAASAATTTAAVPPKTRKAS